MLSLLSMNLLDSINQGVQSVESWAFTPANVIRFLAARLLLMASMVLLFCFLFLSQS